MMLLAVIASPCAPMVTVLLPSQLLLAQLLSFLQWADAPDSPTQILALCSRATLAGSVSFSILLEQHLVSLESFLLARASFLTYSALILHTIFSLSLGGFLGTGISSSI